MINDTFIQELEKTAVIGAIVGGLMEGYSAYGVVKGAKAEAKSSFHRTPSSAARGLKRSSSYTFDGGKYNR